MLVTIVLDGRFQLSPDGSVWSGSAFPYAFWTRYLEVFDQALVVARLGLGEPQRATCAVTGTRSLSHQYPTTSAHFSMPIGTGPFGGRSHQPSLLTAVVMRAGSQLANVAWPILMSRRHRTDSRWLVIRGKCSRPGSWTTPYGRFFAATFDGTCADSARLQVLPPM